MIDTDIDTEADDAVRAARAIADRDRTRILHLKEIVRFRSYERQFLDVDPANYTAFDREMLARLCWYYRHSLPHHMRPKVNPADPIVHESEAR